jgi:hypothetical protein
MTYGKRSNYRRGSVQKSGPRPNTYPGTCATCGGYVPASAGILTGTKATGYTTTHTESTWKGSPASGGWVGGCPADTDQRNAALGHDGDSFVQNVARNLAAASDNPVREISRRNPRHAYTSSGARMTLICGCEDAPCCGCNG